MGDTCSEVLLVNGSGFPLERLSTLVVDFDEGIDLCPDLLGRGEAGALEGVAAEDGEPDLDLVHPGRMSWGEVEVHVGVPCQPQVALGLVGVEVVQHDVDLPVGVIGDDAVQEVQELEPAAALVVPGLDLAIGDVEGCEQHRDPVPSIFVRLSSHSAPVAQPEITLCPFEGLDGRLLVHQKHHRALRRNQVKAHDLGRLADELGIGADAPRLAAVQVDLPRAQEAPNILLAHVAQRPGQQLTRPVRVARKSRLVQLRQDMALRARVVARRGRAAARSGLVLQLGQALLGIADAPQVDRARHRAEPGYNRPCRHPFSGQQHDPRPKHVALLRRRRANPQLQNGFVVRRQPNHASRKDHPCRES